MSTPRLPHVGLNTSIPGESLYGDDSTIGARGHAERERVREALYRMATAGLTDEPEQPRPPIRVIATVGKAIEQP